MLLHALLLVLAFCLPLVLLLLHRRRNPPPRSGTVLTVLGSGGHTMEALALLHLISDLFPRRLYLYADGHSEEKARDFDKLHPAAESVFKRVHRSREVGQSYLSSVFSTGLATLQTVRALARESPDLLLCTGPGTCVPVCLLAALLRALGVWRTRVVFVESVCRVRSLSLTGTILYRARVPDLFVVQWPELRHTYPRAQFLGRLV